jgi:epoxyqueuosine reductase
MATRIMAEAHRLGFDLVGIVPAGPPATAGFYRAWLQNGYHGQMAYLARPVAVDKRENLDAVLPSVRSVVVVGANYHTQPLPPSLCDDPARGILSSYAWGDDYHDLLLPRLGRLAAFVESEMDQPLGYRAYVDTGPVLERDLAARAGLGFVGKNTNLIHPRLGSWLFLAELLLALELPPIASVLRSSVRQGLPSAAAHGSVTDLDQYEVGDPARQRVGVLTQHADAQSLSQRPGRSWRRQGTCGNCTRCLDACPTGALVAPYVLDSRRCISYLTIELKGPIPRELRPQMGNRVFGCDICQEVCPWNRRFAEATSETAFQPRKEGMAPLLMDFAALDNEGFRRRFRGSPVLRAKRRGLLRNVAVALGNWGNPVAVPALVRALNDAEPLVRGHAAWALGRTSTARAHQALAQALTVEIDPWVRDEIAQST